MLSQSNEIRNDPAASVKTAKLFGTPSDAPLALFDVGFESCRPDYAVLTHLRTCCYVKDIAAGRGEFCINGASYPVCAHDLIFFFPGDIVSYATDPAQPMVLYWASVRGSQAEALLAQCGMTRGQAHLPLRPWAAFTGFVHRCVDSPKDPSTHGFYYTAQAYELLDLLQEALPQVTASPAAYPAAVSSALGYIQAHYAQGICVEDVARFVDLERTYFSKLFRQAMGQPPSSYLTAYRLHQAQYLLTHSAFAVRQVAYMVGFTNEYYFSRCFRKHFGQTPGAFRKASRQGGTACPQPFYP